MTIACPSPADAAAWGASNRVELYPGRVQTWVLARAVERDVPSDAELRRMARAVMSRWFSETPILDVSNRSGSADEISVGQVSATPIVLPHVLQGAGRLPGPVPTLRPGRVVYVSVRFVWRSLSELSRPWPTWRVNWGFGGACPVEADWMLAAVGSEQAELPEAAPESSLPEQIESAAAAVGSELRWIGIGLFVAGGAYLVNALRGR
jgi:hypothetical protein